MVRSSFPGKPAKYFTRKKCSSSVNNLDVEGFTVAEELIKSLGVFESLVQDSVEVTFQLIYEYSFPKLPIAVLYF